MNSQDSLILSSTHSWRGKTGLLSCVTRLSKKLFLWLKSFLETKRVKKCAWLTWTISTMSHWMKRKFNLDNDWAAPVLSNLFAYSCLTAMLALIKRFLSRLRLQMTIQIAKLLTTLRKTTWLLKVQAWYSRCLILLRKKATKKKRTKLRLNDSKLV